MKNKKTEIKIAIAINQKYIGAITCLLQDITKALQNYTTTMKKIGKE